MILAAFLLLACAQPEPLVLAPSGEFTLIGGEAKGIDFDAEGERMLTYGWFGDLVLWDLNTLEVIGGMSFPGEEVQVVALHPTRLVGALVLVRERFAPSEVCLVDLATGRVLDRREGGNEGLAWNEAGDVLAVGGRVVSLFDLAEGEPSRLIDERKVALDNRKRDDVAELLAFAGRWSGWRGATEKYRTWSGLPGRVWVAHAPGGVTSVVADKAGQLHVSRAKDVRVVVGHLAPVEQVVFTPDGGHVAARGGNAVTFATGRGEVVGRLPGAATLTPGTTGSQVWLVGPRQARLVEAAEVQVVQTRDVPGQRGLDIGEGFSTPFFVFFREQPRPRPRALVVGADLVVTVGSRPARWSYDAMETLTSNPAPDVWRWGQHFVRSRDGSRWAAVWSWDDDPGLRRSWAEPAGFVRVSTASGEVLLAGELGAAATSAALSPKGATLALGVGPRWGPRGVRQADTPRLELRDATSGEVRARRTVDVPVLWLAYRDADTLLAILASNLEVLDATTLEVRQTIDLGGPVGAADLSLDGSRLAIARGPRVHVYLLTR